MNVVADDEEPTTWACAHCSHQIYETEDGMLLHTDVEVYDHLARKA